MILLTGGSGMVGRNVLEHPRAAELEVWAPKRQELDLLDVEQVTDALRRRQPDVIVHAAGTVGGIAANMAEPARFLYENMAMGMNLLKAAADAGVGRVLNLGSSCMYPRGESGTLREDQILTGELEPTNEGYAIAKIATQRLGAYFGRQDPGLQYKTVIPCNLYGRHDHFDPSRSHMVPAAIAKVHGACVGGETVTIWGTGQVRREFMYAADLADFIFTAVERFESLPDLLNVGLGHDHTINEYYSAIAAVVGYQGEFEHDTSKPEGMARKLVDTTRLTEFGWSAPTSLDEGLRRTYDYYLKEVA